MNQASPDSMDRQETIRDLPPWFLRALLGRRPKWTLVRVAALVVLSFVVFKFVLRPIRVEGISMAPTYRPGSINFINKLAYRWSDPQRGDVVAVRFAGESVFLLKRIVGLPGERVTLDGGVVYVNGERLEENYVKLWGRSYWRKTWELEGDEYLVIGDNRALVSDETHYKGAARRERIIGKVLF